MYALIEYLVNAGADINGLTPFDVAPPEIKKYINDVITPEISFDIRKYIDDVR